MNTRLGVSTIPGRRDCIRLWPIDIPVARWAWAEAEKHGTPIMGLSGEGAFYLILPVDTNPADVCEKIRRSWLDAGNFI